MESLLATDEFGLSDTSAGTMYGVWGLLLTIYMLPGSLLVDRLGVRNASHQRVYSLNPDGTLRETDDAEAFAEPPRELVAPLGQQRRHHQDHRDLRELRRLDRQAKRDINPGSGARNGHAETGNKRNEQENHRCHVHHGRVGPEQSVVDARGDESENESDANVDQVSLQIGLWITL